MATPRDGSYVWVTWITGLLSGDAHCEWAAWFKAHHTYTKQPSDFDLATWKAQHADLVRSRVASLKSEGYAVYVEDQNRFKLAGKSATLAGTLDIVAFSGEDALIVDCKTGRQKNADYFQVLTYMLVLPVVHPAGKGRQFRGEVRYRETSLGIPAEKISADLRELFRSMVERVGGSAFSECRFCDITSADCPERVEREPEGEARAHDLF